MPPSQGVTETLILHLKEGVNLEDMTTDFDSSRSSAVRVFVQLTSTLKSQDGFTRQFWGHQVEDQNVFVWSIDWESFNYSTAFSKSAEYDSFMTGLDEVFDLKVAAPLTIYTRFTTNAAAAFEAGATEVAFYTLPTDTYNEELKTRLEKEMDVPSMEAIKTVGRSSGGATGWVFETLNDATEEGHSIALHGVFGYPTVGDHKRWRVSPEHAQVMKEMASVADVDLRSANVPGGGLFVPGESMFHVKFHAGT